MQYLTTDSLFNSAKGCYRIGRQLLLRMLRADIPNRGAWAEATQVTPDIVKLYKEPSRLEGWEKAIIEVGL